MLLQPVQVLASPQRSPQWGLNSGSGICNGKIGSCWRTWDCIPLSLKQDSYQIIQISDDLWAEELSSSVSLPLTSSTDFCEKHKPSSNLICLPIPHNIYIWPVCVRPPRQILCQFSGLVAFPAQQSFIPVESWGLYQKVSVQCYWWNSVMIIRVDHYTLLAIIISNFGCCKR